MAKKGDKFEFETSLWQRSQNSYATTIPKQILAIKGAPTGEDARVKWSIDQETGDVVARFTEDESE